MSPLQAYPAPHAATITGVSPDYPAFAPDSVATFAHLTVCLRDSRKIHFPVTVAADGEAVVRYTVRYTC